MTLRQCCDSARRRIQTIYPANEAQSMVRVIFHHLKGYELSDLLMKADDEVSDYISGKVDSIVDRLLRHEPLQYILGEARFYGLTFKVTPATLIPRQETEEMVDLIVKKWQSHNDLKVLDLCTGSGCIAIALARNLPFSQVEAIDLSEAALEVARANGEALRVKVKMTCADVLTMPKPVAPTYDIIVSNPPYVLESEKGAMDKVVLDNEPATALFVPDDDPLKFYKPIIEYAAAALRPGGMAYLEINPLEADALRRFVTAGPWSDSEIVTDISGKKRFLILTRGDIQ